MQAVYSYSRTQIFSCTKNFTHKLFLPLSTLPGSTTDNGLHNGPVVYIIQRPRKKTRTSTLWSLSVFPVQMVGRLLRILHGTHTNYLDSACCTLHHTVRFQVDSGVHRLFRSDSEAAGLHNLQTSTFHLQESENLTRMVRKSFLHFPCPVGIYCNTFYQRC